MSNNISVDDIVNELDIMGGCCSNSVEYIVCHTAIDCIKKIYKIQHIINQSHNNAFIFRDPQFLISNIEDVLKGG